MARPKNQAERRIQLIAAATRAVLEHGSTGARLADIAQNAGLTSASVLYYYPDIRELFTAVFERGSAEYCLRRERYVAEAATAAEALGACVRSGVPRPGVTEETSRLLYELAPIVLRNEAAAARNNTFIARQAALYEKVLRDGQESGDFRLAGPAETLARGFVALEDGYGMDVLTGAAPADEVEQALLLHARVMTGTSGIR
ncbi:MULTISPECIES: TetR/AcrR family transcriptional regulator [Streptomyces]|uniref:TetR family transcriptional regulator n=2 Tax=Streptomyces TaxID=1883 RepID=A0ABQ7FEQ3_9ACTN|nr:MULTISPECIES: TetR family transcriptional regulator C-terminal domain-containing protein [Streptomyces]KAF4407501.1 TetR family transcriptional regulator [Streptomyces lycii]PGH52212.1 TetR family transcriptional regulator [Streptomyces sp. Ru87]